MLSLADIVNNIFLSPTLVNTEVTVSENEFMHLYKNKYRLISGLNKVINAVYVW